MKVVDGFDQMLKCSGFVNETKASFKETSIVLGEIPICMKEERFLSLKNSSKYITVYQVVGEKLPPYTDVSPLKGKIMPDDTVFLRVFFSQNIIQFKFTILFLECYASFIEFYKSKFI